MKLQTTRSDLCRCLSLVSGVVAKNSTIPVLSNVKLHADADTLTITGTDLDIALTVRTKAQVETPGVITLPARKLLDYARLLPDGDIRFKVGDNYWVTITAGRARTRIAGMGADSFPETPAVPERYFSIPAPKLAELIGRVRFAISREESRFTLNGALMEIGGGRVRLVATDGHRIAIDEADFPSESNLGAVIPTVAASTVEKLAGDAPAESAVEVGHDDNHLFFRVGNSVLIARKITGNFPDYGRVLPKQEKIAVTLNRADLAGAINRVAQFADERSRAIRVRLKDGIELSATSIEQGESFEGVACEYAGTEIEIGFNAGYLIDFLSAVSGENITLHLNDAKSAAELRPAEVSNYRYVVMPMRI